MAEPRTDTERLRHLLNAEQGTTRLAQGYRLAMEQAIDIVTHSAPRVDTEGDGELRTQILDILPMSLGAKEAWDTTNQLVALFGDVEQELAVAQARGDGWRQKYNEDTDKIAGLEQELARLKWAVTQARGTLLDAGQLPSVRRRRAIEILGDVLASGVQSEDPKQ